MRRGGRSVLSSLTTGCLLCFSIAAAVANAAPDRFAVEGPTGPVLDALRAIDVELESDAPARYRLHYRGPLARPFGPLCYRFAGYNETCTRLPEPWLTPASRIELFAPGGVPLDLLDGYQLLLRFPYWTEETFVPRHQHPSPARGAP